jgi:hypothetical protein
MAANEKRYNVSMDRDVGVVRCAFLRWYRFVHEIKAVAIK